MSQGSEALTRSLAQKSVANEHFAFLRCSEHEAIQSRRDAQIPPRSKIENLQPNGIASGPSVYNLSGLSLSGGGVRSAAFCLGVLQALDHYWGIKCVDYLSTVSGGGYIGSSLTASFAKTGAFSFSSPDDRSDSPAIGHLRNFSNYLLPRDGHLNFLKSLAVILRGLFANFCLVLVVMVPVAGLYIWAYPTQNDLLAGSFLTRVFHSTLWPWPFALSIWFLLTIAAFAIAWAVWRSLRSAPGRDVRGLAIEALAILLVLSIAIAVLDLQPVVLAGLFALNDMITKSQSVASWLKDAAASLAPLGAVTGFFSNRLGRFLKSTQRTHDSSVRAARIAAATTLGAGALAIPLALWLTFLCLCLLGIRHGSAGPFPFGLVDGSGDVVAFAHSFPLLGIYAALFVVLLLITLAFKPNANSLHSLYRDRLSKAFLFDPSTPAQMNGNEELQDLDDFPLKDMSPPNGGPYHLINAALNIQASPTANRRGRNADFFLFSSKFVGSDLTGYVSTAQMRHLDPALDLATAMAISGAAISSDMGSKSIAILAPTLALLNLRLGYWTRNPNSLDRQSFLQECIRHVSKFYLLLEMFGLLTENDQLIYLTDGGHIENLGIYQLLKRGCRFIVAVDAEADPEMVCPSLIDVQRYARIDLGVQIELPWQEIAETSKRVNETVEAGKPVTRAFGPHCALGTIHYPNGVDGYLLYVKSSLSGDENDYILDYKRRNPTFPHETTSDQFFSEEQFEVYRSLGFHAIASAFKDEAGIAWTDDGSAGPMISGSGLGGGMSPAYRKLRDILDEFM